MEHPSPDVQADLARAEEELLAAARRLVERWPPFASALHSTPPELTALRTATSTWARRARAAGHLPEWLLIRARQLLEASPFTERFIPREKGGWDRLDAFVARCAVEAYFSAQAVDA